jgi:RHS repeat-associated protein
MAVCDTLDELRGEITAQDDLADEHSSLRDIFLTKYVGAYVREYGLVEEISKIRDSTSLDSVALNITNDILNNIGAYVDPTEIGPIIVSVAKNRAILGCDSSKNEVNQQADPVIMFSGQFIHEVTDITINGAGIDFLFTRTYKNQVPFNGPLGFNWTHNFHIWLRVANQTIFRTTGDLREEAFTKHPKFGETLNDDFDYWIPPDGKDGIIFVGDAPYSFILRLPDGVRYLFQQDSAHAFLHYLKRIEDRHGNYLELHYQDDLLRQVEINHPERVVEFESDEQGRIALIRDYTGRQWQYTYDSFGDLIAVTSPSTDRYPEGLTVYYNYSSAFFTGELQHNLTRIIDATGQIYLENEYGTEPGLINFNRIVRQRQGGGEYSFEYEDIPQEFDFDYPDEQRPAHQTILVERNGQPVRHIYNKFGNLLCRDQWILQNGLPRNLVEQYRYNRDGNVVASLSPEGVLKLNLYGRDRFVYQHDVTRNGDVPTDQLTWRERQAFGRLLSTVTRADYVSFSNLNLLHEWGNLADIFNRLDDTQNRDVIVKFTYEPDYGQLLTASDPRYTNSPDPQEIHEHPLHQITLTKYLYDGPSSDESRFLVEISRPTPTLPDGTVGTLIVEQFKNSDGTPGYDEHGRLLRHINPAGVVTEYSYFPADPLRPAQEGYLQRAVIDPGGLTITTEYEVDNLGRVVAVHLPRSVEDLDDRFVTRTRYNELDQVIEITTPRLDGFSSGYTTQRFYDRNGKLQREEHDAKDETGLDTTDAPEVHTHKYDEEFNLVEETIGGADLSAHLITRHGYDSAGKKVLTILPKGNQIRYTYNERLLLVAVTRGACTDEAATTRTEYDGDGRVRRTFDARGNSTTFTRDPFGRVIAVEDALGNVTLTHYDKASNVTCVRFFERREDGYYLLARNETDYDELNQAIRKGANRFDDPLGSLQREDLDTAFLASPGPGTLLVTQTFYDTQGRVVRTVDPLMREQTFTYDALDRLIIATDPLGNETHNRYDAHNNLVRRDQQDVVRNPVTGAVVGERIFSTASTYDELDRMVTSTDSLGNVTHYAYDSRGNQVRRVDALGNVISMEHDIFNRRVATHQELTDTGLGSMVQERATTSYEYDANGNLLAIIDALGRRTQYIFDARDRRRAIVYPDESQSSFDYDLDGNLIRTQDNNGLCRLYTIDALGRTVRVDVDRTGLDLGLVVEGENYEVYSYDGLGRRHYEENDFAHTDIHFNSLGWPLTETVRFTTLDAPFEATLTVSREFNDVGALSGLTYPNGRHLHYERDSLNRLIQVNNLLLGDAYPGNPTTPDAYNIATMEYADRQRIRCAFGNGAETHYAHDGAGRLIEIAHTSPTNPLLTIQYLFDAVGNVRVRHDLSPTLDIAEKFAYDSLYRLANQALESRLPFDSLSLAPATAIPADPIPNRQSDIDSLIGPLALPPGARTLTYDLVGNRDNELLTDDSLVDYTINELDQYTTRNGDTFSYDANGNLKTDNQHHYFYDSLNRLVRVEDAASGTTIVKFLHDSRGRRILELNSQATHLVWDRDDLIAEYRDGAPFALYVFDDGLDHPLQIAAEENEHWYHADLVGSVRKLTDQSGNESASYMYTPFGQMADSDISTYNPLRYAARRIDDNLRTYDYRARQYSPQWSRFLQRDPAGTIDGTNLYTYASNNPLTFIDMFGLGRPEIVLSGLFSAELKRKIAEGEKQAIAPEGSWVKLGMMIPTALDSLRNLSNVLAMGQPLLGGKPISDLLSLAFANRYIKYRSVLERRFWGRALLKIGKGLDPQGVKGFIGWGTKKPGAFSSRWNISAPLADLILQMSDAPEEVTDVTGAAVELTTGGGITAGLGNIIGFSRNILQQGWESGMKTTYEQNLIGSHGGIIQGATIASEIFFGEGLSGSFQPGSEISNILTGEAAESGKLGPFVYAGNWWGDQGFLGGVRAFGEEVWSELMSPPQKKTFWFNQLKPGVGIRIHYR